MKHHEWEQEISELLADELEISFSDAQGIIDAQEVLMANAWAQSQEAAQVVQKLAAITV